MSTARKLDGPSGVSGSKSKWPDASSVRKLKTDFNTGVNNAGGASAIKKQTDADSLRKTLDDPNIGNVVQQPAKSVNNAFDSNKSDADMKDPDYEAKKKKDMEELAKDPDNAKPQTDAGKRMKKDYDDASPEKKSSMKENFEMAAKFGTGALALSAFIYFCIRKAKEDSGCYIVKANGDKVKACTQADCSIGTSCGVSGGAPNSEGKCCPTQSGKCSPTDTCQCVEVTPGDVAMNTANRIVDNAFKLADMGLDGLFNIGKIIDMLLQNLPLFLIAVGIIFVAPKIFAFYRTIVPATPQVTVSAPQYIPQPQYIYAPPSPVQMPMAPPK